MLDWRQAVSDAEDLQDLQKDLSKEVRGVFPNSLNIVDGRLFFMVKESWESSLIVVSIPGEADQFQGRLSRLGIFTVKEAPLNGHNAKLLRAVLPWTAPQAFGPSGISLGLGDRLGLASPGHLQALAGTPVRPVLAQQSMRELQLTERTYGDVLDAACWAVFREGYKQGYGADGDHLKNVEDIQTALELGFSMITLDCSEHIEDGVLELDDLQVSALYNELACGKREEYEKLYRDQRYTLASGGVIEMNRQGYKRMILTYHRALDFMQDVYEQVIGKLDRVIDFEISIDEVATPTTPQDHFFVANELQKRGVQISSIAPRFCGEFEKGIDYRGDLDSFEEEFIIHAQIARHFGYKLSIHSGSDKFRVFPVIGKYASQAGYHVKTAGTNWLEAVRVIAHVDPGLYRKMHTKALESLEEARKYYLVSMDQAKIPPVENLKDEELPGLLNEDDARQLLHITYGFMLRDQELSERIYTVLNKNEAKYGEFLVSHLGRHLRALGL